MRGVSKGPKVELVHGLIINVGRDGLDVMIFGVYAHIAVQFLLVANEVLVTLASDMLCSARQYLKIGHDPGILNTLDGLARHHTSEVQVVACAFAVTTARR